MMKKTMILMLCMIAFNANSFAETRLGPYTPDQLYEMSSLVFEGTVVAIETTNDKFEKTFPIKASVENILKGKYASGLISFKHKNPGRSLIHPAEYNAPSVGQKGRFYVVEYVADKSEEFLLIAYHAESEVHIDMNSATKTSALFEKRVVARDVPPTQAGVVKVKEYYDDNDMLVMKEWLKPKDILQAEGNSDALVVQSRHKYFYNQDKRKLLEIWELPDGTDLTTITEYNNEGQIIAERSFNSHGHNHFTRLYEDGKVVKVLEEGRK